MRNIFTLRHIRGVAPLIFGLLLPLAAIRFATSAQQAAGAGASAASGQPAPQTSPPAPPVAPKPTLADFAWLAGRWQGAWGPRAAQQVWTVPQAGVMLGTFQLTEGDKTLVLELFTLIQSPDGIKFNLRHFTPALVAWERPGPTVLNLASVDSKHAVFENLVDGQPKHAIFTQLDPDTYVSRSEILPEKGEMQVTEITYHRQFDGAPPKRSKEKKEKPRQ